VTHKEPGLTVSISCGLGSSGPLPALRELIGKAAEIPLDGAGEKSTIYNTKVSQEEN
jgi:hypothetical protein